MSYKLQIEKALLNIDFEVVIFDLANEWWNDENWKVQFKFNPGIYFYLCFFDDPYFEGWEIKHQRILKINAVTEFPKNWNDDSNLIASLQMQKGNFKKKLAEFICEIEAWKIIKIQDTGIKKNL